MSEYLPSIQSLAVSQWLTFTARLHTMHPKRASYWQIRHPRLWPRRVQDRTRECVLSLHLVWQMRGLLIRTRDSDDFSNRLLYSPRSINIWLLRQSKAHKDVVWWYMAWLVLTHAYYQYHTHEVRCGAHLMMLLSSCLRSSFGYTIGIGDVLVCTEYCLDKNLSPLYHLPGPCPSFLIFLRSLCCVLLNIQPSELNRYSKSLLSTT